MMCLWNYLRWPVIRLNLRHLNPSFLGRRRPSVIDPTTLPPHWRRDLGIDL
jgi:hypothetical protein